MIELQQNLIEPSLDESIHERQQDPMNESYQYQQNNLLGVQQVVINQNMKMSINISEQEKQLYPLPFRKAVDINQIFQFYRQPQNQDVDIEMQPIIINLDKEIEKNLFLWDYLEGWGFKLPPSVFVANTPPIYFSQNIMNEGISELSTLSDEQLRSIKREGQFIAKSNRDDELRAIWKINPFFIKGSLHIWNTFLENMSVGWNQILQIKNRLSIKQSKEDYSFLAKFTKPNFVRGLLIIVNIFGKLVNLTIGLKMHQMYNDSEVKKIFDEEWYESTFLQIHHDLKSYFFEFIANVNQNQEMSNERMKLDILQCEFNQKVIDFEQQQLNDFQSRNRKEEEALLEILQEKQNLLFNKLEQDQCPSNEAVRSHLISLIRACQITTLEYQKLKESIQENNERIQKEIRENHPVKSLVENWAKKRQKQLMKPIINNLITQANERIIEYLNQFELKSEKILFERYASIQLKLNFFLKLNYSRIQDRNPNPKRVFITDQYVLGEREIQSQNNNGQIYYNEVVFKRYDTPTSYFGWRIVLQLVRYKVWTVNLIKILVDNIISGDFGIKALFWCSPFSSSSVIWLFQKQLF